MVYLRIYESKAGGWVDLHPLHGQDELSDNMEACRILADNGFKIQLLPCLSASEVHLRKSLLPDVFGNKNPDIRINNALIGDIKTLDKKIATRKATISNAISRAALQKISIVVLNLSECQYAVQDIKKGIVGALQPDRNKSIKSVWIITKNKSLFMIDRREVFDDSVYEVLNTL